MLQKPSEGEEEMSRGKEKENKTHNKYKVKRMPKGNLFNLIWPVCSNLGKWIQIEEGDSGWLCVLPPFVPRWLFDSGCTVYVCMCRDYYVCGGPWGSADSLPSIQGHREKMVLI